MRLHTAILTTLLTLGSTGIAAAQTRVPTGSRIPETIVTEELDRSEARRVQEIFAACVYERRPERVEALLAASDMYAVDYKAAGIAPTRISAALAMEPCLSRATEVTDSELLLKLNFPSLRAMLLEQSYRARNKAGPAWLSGTIAAPARRFVAVGEKLGQAQAIAAFADCLVAAAQREADALLRTSVGSAAEKAALKPLLPHLGPCVTAGAEVKLDLTRIRALVADGLWTASRSAGDRTPVAQAKPVGRRTEQ